MKRTPLKPRKSWIERSIASKRKKRSARLPGTKKPTVDSISKLKKKLWKLCKLITRKRYAVPGGWMCYTSGKLITEPKDAHTGHFIHSSLCSVELRYDLRNLRVQSYDQNINKNGNTLQFQENLIRDNGEEYVNELKERNKATKGLQYGRDWYLNRIEEYTKLLKTLV